MLTTRHIETAGGPKRHWTQFTFQCTAFTLRMSPRGSPGRLAAGKPPRAFRARVRRPARRERGLEPIDQAEDGRTRLQPPRCVFIGARTYAQRSTSLPCPKRRVVFLFATMCAANITAKHARLGGSSGREYDRLGASSGKTGRNLTANRAGRRRRCRGASLEPEEASRVVALFAITCACSKSVA